MDEITKVKGELEHLKKVVIMLLKRLDANDRIIQRLR